MNTNSGGAMTFNARRFLDRGYDFVELDVQALPIQPLFSGLAGFLEQDVRMLEHWKVPVGRYYDPDPGYHRKDGAWDEEIGEFSDQKYYFHWSPELRRMVTNQASGEGQVGQQLETWKLWLAHQRHVYLTCEAIFHRISAQIDACVGGTRLTDRCTVPSILRTMQYDAGMPGKVHTDKSGITFHVATTHPGYLLEGDHVESPPGQVLVFGGRRLAFLLERPHLSKLHEAVAYEGVDGQKRKVIPFFGYYDTPELQDREDYPYDH